MCFEIIIGYLSWFFIGYWILKQGWISIRPSIFLANEKAHPQTCRIPY